MSSYSALLHNIKLLSYLSTSSLSLPFPSIVLLSSPLIQDQTLSLISALTLNQPILLLSNTLLANNQYQISTSEIEGIKPKIYNLNGIGCKAIKDSDYKLKKKYLYKLSKQPEVIYVVLLQEHEQQADHLGVHFVEELDPLKKRSTVITLNSSTQQDFILNQIARLYLSFKKLQVVSIYRQLLKLKQNLSDNMTQIQQFNQLLIDSQQNIFPYLYKQHHLFTQSITAELEGSFVTSRQLKMKTPLKCLMMTRLQQLWMDDYCEIMKRLESISVKEIQELLIIHNTELMHGFLSSNCFKNIFYTYMTQLQECLMRTIEEIVQILLITVQHMVHHYLKYLNIKEIYSEAVIQKILPLTSKFIEEVRILVHSQIEYIYMSDEKYWNLSTVNTSLYANSTYIEIKYIGIAYIKRLAESLQEILPKIMGDGLISKVGRVIMMESLILLQDTITHTEVRVEVGSKEREKGLETEKRAGMVEEIMRYFTRHVDPVSLIPDIQQKIEAMFLSCQTLEKQDRKEVEEEPLGFFQRIKRLFVRGKKEGKNRSSSEERSKGRETKVSEFQKDNTLQFQNPLWIKQSQWLLVINTNKSVSIDRLQYSSRQGFPTFLRISIWVYLSSRDFTPPSIKQLLHPSSLQKNLIPLTYDQIQKDIRRTPPPELFAFDERAKQIMREVLIAYSIYDPQVGYIQGMNFIVSMIIRSILNYEEKDYANTMRKHENNGFTVIEQQTLTILSFIIKKLRWRQYFIQGTPRLFQLSLQIQDRIKREIPGVYERMRELEMSSFLIFTETIMTALTAKIPISIGQRVFDRFLIEGEKLIENIIIKLLKANEKSIREMESSDELFMMFREGIYQSRFSLIAMDEILKG